MQFQQGECCVEVNISKLQNQHKFCLDLECTMQEIGKEIIKMEGKTRPLRNYVWHSKEFKCHWARDKKQVKEISLKHSQIARSITHENRRKLSKG